MKLRAILNGLAALTAIGAFYTFAFCIVDDVDTNEISQEYYYNTATETQTTTEKIEKAEMDIKPDKENTTHIRDNIDLPEQQDDIRVENQINSQNNYEDVQDISENTPDQIEVTPLAEPEAAETTYVPDAEHDNEKTESAAPVQTEAVTEREKDDFDYDSVPVENDEDMVFSENYIGETDVNSQDAYADSDDTDADLLSELDRETTETQPSTEEIERRLEEMQEALNETTTASPDDGDYVFSEGTYFETVPSMTETTESETELTTTTPEGNEIFTAKIGGKVQEYDAYQLVCMIVSTEMSPSFNQEALKAQAVAAYSYVKYHNVKGLIPTVLVKYDIPDEVRTAVSAVWGKCCYYNGQVAQTVYTASSAGTTASAVNVWGGNDVPYLTSVATPFDVQSDPNYGVIQTFSAEYMRSALESSLGITLSDTPENWLTITSRVDGNYVSGVNVDGQVIVSGRKIRESVLKFGIKSWCFDVTYADGEFTFVTYGYGHGVGMSQNGANILGKQGYTYDQILMYYFPGITIS